MTRSVCLRIKKNTRASCVIRDFRTENLSVSRMVDRVALISPHVYFKTSFRVNENNVQTFRDLYRRLSRIDRFDGHEIDQISLRNAARQLGIQADSDDHQKVLQTCVQFENIEQTFLYVDINCQDSVPAQLLNRPSTTDSLGQHPRQKSEVRPAVADAAPTVLKEIQCMLTVKRGGELVNQFLQNYLLQIVKQTGKNT